jgi:predicted DNA-binding transcriptional regulator AlpA
MTVIRRLPAVKARYGDASTADIYKAISQGRFPRPVPLFPGSRAVGWRNEDLDAHDARCVAERDAKLAQVAAAKEKLRAKRPRLRAGRRLPMETEESAP